MNVLALGDVVGSSGCEALKRHLPSLKKLYQADLVIANGENSADGNGITPASANALFDAGVHVITSGNHVFRRREVYDMLDENPYLLRPAIFPDTAPGKGLCLIDTGPVTVAVCNVMGVVYLDSLSCPFETADRLVEQAKAAGAKIILMDVHAEATSEKKALAYYLDGRISALFGTHTHVITGDEQILPQGTGYITDLGMTGPYESVLGVKPALAIARQKDKLPVRFENATGNVQINGCFFEIDRKTGNSLQVMSIKVV